VDTYRFNEAADLLRALSPNEGCFYGPYSYRGQSDAAWPLIPSAWRDYAKFRKRVVTRDPDRIDGLVFYEASILLSFTVIADIQGLPIPSTIGCDAAKDFLAAFADLTPMHPDRLDTWPPYELLEIMALAQHHGAPTRLLDWSDQPYPACYFACEEFLNLSPEECQGEIAVWLYRGSAESVRFPHHGMPSAFPDEGIRMYRPPYFANPNARSQQGSLMYVTASAQLEDERWNIRWNPSEGIPDFLARRWVQSDVTGTSPFTKLTLPKSEALDLKTLLGNLGVTASSLFPGYSGAARAARADAYGMQTFDENQSGVTRFGMRQHAAAERMEQMLSEGRVHLEE
jgi:hypothetical protein